MKSTVLTFYMANMPCDIVHMQNQIVRRFLPSGCDFHQILTSERHAPSIDRFLLGRHYDVVVLLDVDCIPLNEQVLPKMIENAANDRLVGIAVRAFKKRNNGHVYAGPQGMAFSERLFDNAGNPSFSPTRRGDVGEELTFRCEELEIPVDLFWPVDVISPMGWPLRDGIEYGLGTSYEGGLFHNGMSRRRRARRVFVNKCTEVLTAETFSQNA